MHTSTASIWFQIKLAPGAGGSCTTFWFHPEARPLVHGIATNLLPPSPAHRAGALVPWKTSWFVLLFHDRVPCDAISGTAFALQLPAQPICKFALMMLVIGCALLPARQILLFDPPVRNVAAA